MQLGPDTPIKDTWAKLSNAIREIQNHNASKLSFEEHYRYAYNMVLFKREPTCFIVRAGHILMMRLGRWRPAV